MLLNLVPSIPIKTIYELGRDYWNAPTRLWLILTTVYSVSDYIVQYMEQEFNIRFGGFQTDGKCIHFDPDYTNVRTNRSYSLQTNPLGVRSLNSICDPNFSAAPGDDITRLLLRTNPPGYLPLSYANEIFDDNYGPAMTSAKGYKNQYLFLRYMADKFSESGQQSHSIVLLSFPSIVIDENNEIVQKPRDEIIAQRAKMIKCLLKNKNMLIITFGYKKLNMGSDTHSSLSLIIRPSLFSLTIVKIQITYFDPHGYQGRFKYIVMQYIAELLSAIAILPHKRWSPRIWNYAQKGSFREEITANNITFIFTPSSSIHILPNYDNRFASWLSVICFIYIVIAFSDKSTDNLDGNIITATFPNNFKLKSFFQQFVMPFMRYWSDMRQYGDEYDNIIRNASYTPAGGEEKLYYLGPPIFKLSEPASSNKASLYMCCCDIQPSSLSPVPGIMCADNNACGGIYPGIEVGGKKVLGFCGCPI